MARPVATVFTLDRSISRLYAVLSEAQAVVYALITTLVPERNSCLPIARLPAELLCHIFKFVVDGADQRERARALLQLSHTNTHWRDVCIGNPTLWTFLAVDSMPTKLAALFIRRSSTSPLTIRFDWSTYRRDST